MSIRSWPTAIVLVAAILAIAATVLFGPSLGVDAETLRMLLGSEAVISALVLSLMRGVGQSADPAADERADKRARRRTRSGPPPGTTLLLTLVLALVSACGGPPRATRVAIEQLGRGLNVADESIAAAIATRGEEARVQVRREIADRTLAAAAMSDDERVAAGLERFEQLMAPTTAARDAVRAARPAAEAAEGALDSWAAGTGDGAGFAQVAVCVIGAVERVMAAVSAAGIVYPDMLTQALNTIRPIAGLLCAGGL